MIKRNSYALLIGSCLALAGCSVNVNGEPAPTVTVTAEPAPTVTATPESSGAVSVETALDAPVSGSPSEPVPEATFTMPALAGENLQLAQDTLQSLGSFALDQKDASGLERFQVNDSNWVVCTQDPVAGVVVPVSTLVVLASVKLGEQCP